MAAPVVAGYNTTLVPLHKNHIPARVKAAVRSDTFFKFMRAHPEIDEALHQITEDLVGDCESTLVKAALKREDIRALQLILAVKGKDRGWNQRYEVTGPNGVPLVGAAPSAADLIAALEAVLERQAERRALAPPEGPPLLELSAEPARAVRTRLPILLRIADGCSEASPHNKLALDGIWTE